MVSATAAAIAEKVKVRIKAPVVELVMAFTFLPGVAPRLQTACSPLDRLCRPA
jgi:hypothetical protein